MDLLYHKGVLAAGASSRATAATSQQAQLFPPPESRELAPMHGLKGTRHWVWMGESDQTSDQSDQSELLPQAEARSEKEQGFTVK